MGNGEPGIKFPLLIAANLACSLGNTKSNDFHE